MYHGYEDFEEPNKKMKTVCIKQLNLLYSLSQEGLLEYMVNICQDKNNPDKRVWIFQHTVEVQDVINEFHSGSHKYKNNKKSEVIKN